MMRRPSSVLFFVSLLLTGAPSTEAAEPVLIEGTITYTGPVPKPVSVPDANSERQLIEVQPKTNGLKDAVVWLEGVKAPAERIKRKAAVMDQRGFFFVPHVLAIEADQEVEFLNNDQANHGVQATAFEDKNCFNVFTPFNGSYKHRFVAARRPIPIGCPIHPGMAAWIFVFDHPYFAVSDAAGKFRLPAVPPGSYTLVVRHMDGVMLKKVMIEVKEGKSLRQDIAFTGDDMKAK